MKKLFFILTTLAFVNVLAAQNTLPNEGFENWSGGGTLSQEQPDDWTTGLLGNVLVQLYGIDLPVPVNAYFGEKSTDAHSGSYALNLHAATVGIPYTSYSYKFPGIAQLGRAAGFEIPLSTILSVVDIISSLSQGDTSGIDFDDLDLESLTPLLQALAPGAPVAQTPAHLNMWVKFHPYGNDMLNVIAYSKLNGIPVGFAEYSSADAFDEYTLLRIPFENALEPCDTLAVIIVSGGISTNDSTELLIDDISVDYELDDDAVNEYAVSAFSCYPNPAEDFVCIQPTFDGAYQYELLDMQGRVVLASAQAQGLTRVSTYGLAPGLYLLNVCQQGQTCSMKVLVR